jgi:hypothetical protein
LRRLTLSRVVRAALAGTAALLLATPAPAGAVPGGALTFFPSNSIDTASIKARTPGGCPEPADSYYAVVTGHGFPSAGQTVTTPTSAGMTRTEPFDVYFGQTMKDFAADNKTTLTGRYNVAVYCVDSFLGTKYAQYTGSLTFSTPTKYKASGKKTTTSNAIGPVTAPPPSVPAPGSPPAPGTPPAPTGSAPAALPPTASAAATRPAEAAAPGDDSGPPVGWIVAGVVAVLLALEGGRRLGRRSTTRP